MPSGDNGEAMYPPYGCDLVAVERWEGRTDPRYLPGMQIGRVTVRSAVLGESARTRRGELAAVRGWLVEVNNTIVVSLDLVDNALLLADEVERFAAGDLDALAIHDRDAVDPRAILGEALLHWSRHVIAFDRKGKPALGYRQWLNEVANK